VGYAGGTKKSPTYHNLGDHTESIEIDFDPSKISYARLLEIFWATHNPCAQAWSRQYMSAIWTFSPEQQRLAVASKEREELKRRKAVQTEIAPAGVFTLAEDYHQKYELKHDAELLSEFQAYYPSEADLVGSTAAARANAIVGGHGSAELRGEIDRYGLSPSGQKRLLGYFPR
jgi:methionine-S-sulfoxide reductase